MQGIACQCVISFGISTAESIARVPCLREIACSGCPVSHQGITLKDNHKTAATDFNKNCSSAVALQFGDTGSNVWLDCFQTSSDRMNNLQSKVTVFSSGGASRAAPGGGIQRTVYALRGTLLEKIGVTMTTRVMESYHKQVVSHIVEEDTKSPSINDPLPFEVVAGTNNNPQQNLPGAPGAHCCAKSDTDAVFWFGDYTYVCSGGSDVWVCGWRGGVQCRGSQQRARRRT